MQLREIHIDRFGRFTGRHLLDARPGLNVIYGANEFGKTTLLEFVRWVLFGFSQKRGANMYDPVAGGVHGGRLVCAGSGNETMVIAREGGTRQGKVEVRIGDRVLEGEMEVSRLLGHVSREVYRNIFAFTLDELRDFDSLRETDIKDRILGAGLGLGDVSLATVRNDLVKRAEELFSPKARKKEIHLLGQNLQKLKQEIAGLQGRLDQYAELERKQEELLRAEEALQARVRECRSRKQRLERDQRLFPLVVDLVKSEEELRTLDALQDFPGGDYEAFRDLRRKRADLQERRTEAQEKLRELAEQAQSGSIDEALLRRSAEVKSLEQMTESVRSAIADQLERQAEFDRMTREIGQALQQLGPGWDAIRVRDFVLSETDRQQVKKHRGLLEEARQEVRDRKGDLDRYREQAADARRNRPPSWVPLAAAGLSVLGLAGLAWGFMQSNPGLALFSGLVLFAGAALGIASRRGRNTGEDSMEVHYRGQWENARKKEQDRREGWGRWMRQRGLDPEMEPEGVAEWAAALEVVRIKLGEQEDCSRRIRKMQEKVAEAVALMNSLRENVSGVAWSGDTLADLNTLVQHFERQRAASERRRVTAEKIREQEEALGRLTAQWERMNRDLQDLLARAGVDGAAGYEERYQQWIKRQELLKQSRAARREIELNVGMDAVCEEFIQALRGRSSGEIEAEEVETRNELEGIESEQKELNRDIGSTRKALQEMNREDALLALQMEMASQKELLNRKAREWAAATLAVHMLDRARHRYEREHKPQVTRNAERILGFITEGVYPRIVQPIDQETLYIETAQSEKVEPAHMSRGTAEQLYLAMRFGVIQEYENGSEPLPVLMDDVFVNFDDGRRQRMAETLLGFASGRQVIVLTCHRQTLELFRSLGAHILQ